MEWVNSEGSVNSYQSLSVVLSELAKNITYPDEREKLWKRVLSVISDAWAKSKNYKLALELGIRTIDYIEDELAIKASFEISPREFQKVLFRAKKALDEAINQQDDLIYRAELLARKSSILRFNAWLLGITKDRQKKIAEEAHRCVKKAIREGGRKGEIALQEGLSIWLLARFSRSDSEYNTLLRKAEESFWLAYETGDKIYSLLTLSRFFRQTFRPDACCDTFREYIAIETQKRRAWQNSYIYGEAAIQLWYGNRPYELVEKHCKEAEYLLRQALDSGYLTARNIVALAYIKACSGAKVGGEEILKELFHGEEFVSWRKAIEITREAILDGQFTNELIAKGFAFGVNDGSVWNKLGTFAYDFLDDLELAEKLYRVAIKLSPKDPISLSNLARLLIIKDGELEKSEAKSLINKAKDYSDRRFKWWRVVRSLLEPKEKIQKTYQPYRREFEKLPKMLSLKDIRKQYRFLKRMEDHQQRGKLFEKLINSLLKISPGNAIGSHKIPYGTKSTLEIDNTAYFNKDYYRIEVKWENKLTEYGKILKLKERLDVFGLWGLFISMAGFAPHAIETAKEHKDEKPIILMDGEELELVIEEFISFEELIVLKQTKLYFDSNPYYKVTMDDLKLSNQV